MCSLVLTKLKQYHCIFGVSLALHLGQTRTFKIIPMKKIMMIAAIVFAAASFTTAEAQEMKEEKVSFSKIDVSPLDAVVFRNTDKQPMARVLYSRPQKKDRVVFGNLVPYGKVWRTGANEATEITLYSDMMLGGKTVKAGTYTMYTIPNEKEWTIILNKATNVWGAYDYKENMDVARIKVPVKTSPKSIEAFSMAFKPVENGTHLMMGWDSSYVEVPFMMGAM